MSVLISRFPRSLVRFARSRAGAVTADMVPLIAAVAFLGVLVVGVLGKGVETAARSSSSAMGQVEVGSALPDGAGGDAGAEEDAGVLDGVLEVTWAIPTKILSAGWGPEVNSPWLDPAQFGVDMPARFEVIGAGNPRAQTSDGTMATSGVFELGTILKLDTPSCGSSNTVYLSLNDGEEVVAYTVERPEWPADWGAPPAGC